MITFIEPPQSTSLQSTSPSTGTGMRSMSQDNALHAHQGERVQAQVPRVHAERDETKNPPTFDTIICICFLHLPELKIEKEFLR